MEGLGRPAPILEAVVTTINPDGSINCAAMGVEWGEQRIVIKPFRGTRTLRNLRATGVAVVNLTDDILLFSQAALGDPHPPTRPAAPSRARSWRTRARGARCGVEAIDDGGSAPGSHGGGRRWHRARVPRLQPRVPRGPRGLDPRLARAAAPGGTSEPS